MLISPHDIVEQLARSLPTDQAALLGGMILGVSPERSSDLYLNMKNSGLLHLMVLSGSNISFLIGSIYALFIPVGKRAALVLSAIFLLVFVLFVGFEAPVLRATITALITIVYLLDGRKSNALLATAASFAIIIIIDSKLAFSISSQLSYAATMGILLFYQPLIYRGGSKYLQAVYFFLNEICVSISAMIFLVPIIFYHFDAVQFQGILATVLVSPVVGMIMLLGFILCIAVYVFPILVPAITLVVSPFLAWVILVARAFS